MDDEAAKRLIAAATVQEARQQAKRARVNLPIGIVLTVLGIGITIAVRASPLGLIPTVIGGGIGLVLIPAGVAVIVKAAAAIARESRVVRELGDSED